MCQHSVPVNRQLLVLQVHDVSNLWKDLPVSRHDAQLTQQGGSLGAKDLSDVHMTIIDVHYSKDGSELHRVKKTHHESGKAGNAASPRKMQVGQTYTKGSESVTAKDQSTATERPEEDNSKQDYVPPGSGQGSSEGTTGTQQRFDSEMQQQQQQQHHPEQPGNAQQQNLTSSEQYHQNSAQGEQHQDNIHHQEQQQQLTQAEQHQEHPDAGQHNFEASDTKDAVRSNFEPHIYDSASTINANSQASGASAETHGHVHPDVATSAEVRKTASNGFSYTSSAVNSDKDTPGGGTSAADLATAKEPLLKAPDAAQQLKPGSADLSHPSVFSSPANANAADLNGPAEAFTDRSNSPQRSSNPLASSTAQAGNLKAAGNDGPSVRGTPKVALLFLTLRSLPHEPVWRAFFEAASRLPPLKPLPPLADVDLNKDLGACYTVREC